MTGLEIAGAVGAVATLLTALLAKAVPSIAERRAKARLEAEKAAQQRKTKAALWAEMAKQQAQAAREARKRTDAEILSKPPPPSNPAA